MDIGDFAAILVKYRKMKGLSQSSLATKLDLNRQSISLYEKGKSEPGALTFIKICQCLDLDIKDFAVANKQEEMVLRLVNDEKKTFCSRLFCGLLDREESFGRNLNDIARLASRKVKGLTVDTMKHRLERYKKGVANPEIDILKETLSLLDFDIFTYKATCNFVVGRKLAFLAFFDEAVAYLEEFLKVVRTTGDAFYKVEMEGVHLMTDTYYLLSLCYSVLGNHDKFDNIEIMFDNILENKLARKKWEVVSNVATGAINQYNEYKDLYGQDIGDIAFWYTKLIDAIVVYNEETLDFVNQIVDIYRHDARMYLSKAKFHFRNQNFILAVQDIQYAKELDPNNEEVKKTYDEFCSHLINING